MDVLIDRSSRISVQAQVADQIRALVASGALSPGTALPSVRTLAGDLGVNLNTVARAYRLLEDEGFLRIEARVGVVVAAPAAAPEAKQGELRGTLSSLLARCRQAGLSSDELLTFVEDELTTLDPCWRRR